MALHLAATSALPVLPNDRPSDPLKPAEIILLRPCLVLAFPCLTTAFLTLCRRTNDCYECPMYTRFLP